MHVTNLALKLAAASQAEAIQKQTSEHSLASPSIPLQAVHKGAGGWTLPPMSPGQQRRDADPSVSSRSAVLPYLGCSSKLSLVGFANGCLHAAILLAVCLPSDPGVAEACNPTLLSQQALLACHELKS